MSSTNARVPNAAAETAKGFMGKLSAWTGENGVVVLMILGFVLVFMIVVIYISFKIKSSSLQGKRLVQTPIKLDKMAAPLEVPGSMIPTPMVGLEYSYGFWIYIENLDQVNSGHKLLFYRGEAGNVSSANPIVLMDGISNKLNIVLKTANSSLSSATLPAQSGKAPPTYENDLSNISTFNCFASKETTCLPYQNKHVIIPIDYVPIQRWVHVMFTVENKLITVYLDGEIYSVKSVDELKGMKKLPDNLVIDKTTGTVFVGKNPQVGNGNTINGYLSRLEFFNYAVSLNDVKALYANGPLKTGLLSMIGLANYGVRAPIYRIDELQE